MSDLWGGQSGDRQCHQTPERQRLKLPVNNAGASIDVTVLAFTVRPMPAIRRAMVQPLPGRRLQRNRPRGSNSLTFTAQWPPGVANPVDLPFVVPDLLDFGVQCGVAWLTGRGFCWVSPCRQTGVASRWGNLQHRADRLAPVCRAMSINEVGHGLNGRSSSRCPAAVWPQTAREACAKSADALRRIS